MKFCLCALGKKSSHISQEVAILVVFLKVNIFNQYLINNHCLLHEVLTAKDDKDQHFNYRRPKVGLQIFHNTIMTGLIHKILTKATITKLFGLHRLQLVK